jgi:peptide subunit release factor 1 (eRF1)
MEKSILVYSTFYITKSEKTIEPVQHLKQITLFQTGTKLLEKKRRSSKPRSRRFYSNP